MTDLDSEPVYFTRRGDERRCFAGVDVGGTSIRTLGMNGAGEELYGHTIRGHGAGSDSKRLAEIIYRELAAVFESTSANGHEPAAFCIAVPFVTDDRFGVRYASNVDSTLDLAGIIHRAQRRFSSVGTAENDVRCATEGELWRGRLRNVRDGILVNVGTGISIGIVANGQIVRGAHNTAGEIAYQICSLDETGVRGGGTPLEDRASGRALSRAAESYLRTTADALPYDRSAASSGVGSQRADDRPDPASRLISLCRAGSPGAAAVVDALSDTLALHLTNLCIVLDPEVVVLTGGVSAAFDVLEPRISSALRRFVPEPPILVRSSLGETAAVLGAVRQAVAAFDQSC